MIYISPYKMTTFISYTLYSIYLDRSVSIEKKGGGEFMPAMYLGICDIVVPAVFL